MRYRLTAVLLATALSFPALADFDAGLTAYRVKDFDTAYQAFHQAAIQGDETAQFNIGVMYFRGHGVTKDLVKAYSWIELSIQRGNLDNIRALSALTVKLTPDQIQAAHELSAELAAEHGLRYTPPGLSEEEIAIASR